jgi:hypothetical protein
MADVSAMLGEPSAHKLPVERSWWCFAKRLPPGPHLVAGLPLPLIRHDNGLHAFMSDRMQLEVLNLLKVATATDLVLYQPSIAQTRAATAGFAVCN